MYTFLKIINKTDTEKTQIWLSSSFKGCRKKTNAAMSGSHIMIQLWPENKTRMYWKCQQVY